jgi:small multidrug resistance pump
MGAEQNGCNNDAKKVHGSLDNQGSVSVRYRLCKLDSSSPFLLSDREEDMLGWLFLAFAIALEICGTTCMKLSHSFTRPAPSILLFLFYGCSLAMMTLAMRYLEIGVVYAVWSGVGTAVVAVIGVAMFQESVSAAKIICILLIVAGVVGLQLSSRPPTAQGVTWAEKAP